MVNDVATGSARFSCTASRRRFEQAYVHFTTLDTFRCVMPIPLRFVAVPAATLLLGLQACSPTSQRSEETPPEWIDLFNGRNLEGWVPKITGYELGENFANTFRVEDGILQVRYDGYEDFGQRFGHLFFETPFSHYRLVVEYRFVGEQCPGGPDWARRNSGVMLHAQDPGTMALDQDFPISLEVQFLGGLGEGVRPTGNVCTPGTEIVIDGETASDHCIASASPTFDGDLWVRSETTVLGDSLIVHVINGDTVVQYTSPTVGGGVVNGYDPAVKIDGTPLRSGFIALQSESHPIDFRLVELLDLSGQ
jgi:hypothetical protein